MKEGKGRMTDATWLEEKEEGEEKIREALKKNVNVEMQNESDESPGDSEEDGSERREREGVVSRITITCVRDGMNNGA